MPQLNPTPWLMLLVFSWSVFLVFIPSKVMAHIFPNETVVKKEHTEGHNWAWPWL